MTPSPEAILGTVRTYIGAGRRAEETLAFLTDVAERVAPSGSVASILVLDGDGALRNGASPRLPADYLAAIDGIRPDPAVGTCAAAAATGQIVLTPDFLADSKWSELRHLPMALGFAGAWSTPIKSGASGRVLGTFGVYFRQVREPSAIERDTMVTLARGAAEALESNLA